MLRKATGVALAVIVGCTSFSAVAGAEPIESGQGVSLDPLAHHLEMVPKDTDPAMDTVPYVADVLFEMGADLGFAGQILDVDSRAIQVHWKALCPSRCKHMRALVRSMSMSRSSTAGNIREMRLWLRCSLSWQIQALSIKPKLSQ